MVNMKQFQAKMPFSAAIFCTLGVKQQAPSESLVLAHCQCKCAIKRVYTDREEGSAQTCAGFPAVTIRDKAS